jgi:DNA modification methylase
MPTTSAIQFLHRYSIDTIDRITAFSQLRTNAKVDIFHADSRTSEIPAIDGVITSPPYVGLIDYHEQHRYAYELLGLEDKRAHEIGPAVNGSSQKAKTDYRNDIISVFKNLSTSLKKDGILVVVAGDRHGLYNDIAEICGFSTEDIISRHVNRRTGRRSGEFFESVFIWKKC